MIDEATGLRVELHVTGKALEVYDPESAQFLEFILIAKHTDFDLELQRIAGEWYLTKVAKGINNHS